MAAEYQLPNNKHLGQKSRDEARSQLKVPIISVTLTRTYVDMEEAKDAT